MAKARRPEGDIEQTTDQDEIDLIEDDDDDDYDDDEINDEDDEGQRAANEVEQKDDGGAHGLTLVVPNDDPELHTFLNQMAESPGNRDLLAVFADWLADRNDPRSDLVRDIASPGVHPEGSLASASLPAPMVAARFWAAYARRDRVHAAVRSSTVLHRIITAATREDGRTWPRHRPATVVEVGVSDRDQNAKGFQSALDACRVRLLLAMFGTSPEKLDHLQVVKTSSDLREVKKLLYGRQRAETIPWMSAVYKSDRRRFAWLLAMLLEDPALRHLGCEIMDAIEPEWATLIASRLTAGE